MALVPAADAGTPRCYGAASRDRIERCHNPKLHRRVMPSPAQALRLPNAPCRIPEIRYPMVCEFGVGAEGATRRVALVGDSHATHWRAALGPVATSRNWTGFSLTRAGCSLSTAVPRLSHGQTGPCLRWRVAVKDWIAQHPGIDTLFVSQHRAHVAGGYEAEVAGYAAAWNALPEHIRHVVVIRDTPRRPLATRRCVVAAIARDLDAGRVCAMSRGAVLKPDPAADAALRLRSKRVTLIDMTRYFCDASRCFPVIGGALVHKDQGHITARFGATLAPYLERRIVGLGLG